MYQNWIACDQSIGQWLAYFPSLHHHAGV